MVVRMKMRRMKRISPRASRILGLIGLILFFGGWVLVFLQPWWMG